MADAGPIRAGLRAGGWLALIAAITAAVVVTTHDRASPQIELNRQQRLIERLAELLPAESIGADPLAQALEIDRPSGTHTRILRAYRGSRDGAVDGVVFEVESANGYSGTIRLLVGVDPDGAALGARVVEHRETPGLGDAIETRRGDWIHQFDGSSLAQPTAEHWQVKRDGGEFDAITSATITSRAVVGAVHDALLYFRDHRNQLLAAPEARP